MKLHLATILLLSATVCPAAIIVDFGNAPSDVENIKLGSELSATSIDGQVDGFTVLFTGQNGIDLHGSSIREADDPIHGGILFEIPGATFSVFGVNPQRGGKPKKGATLLITAVGTLTTITNVPLTLGSGENRLYVEAQGESLLSVLLGVKGDTYDSYKQPRVGGIEALPIVIPPPVTPPVDPPPVEIPPVEAPPISTPPIETAAVPEPSSFALIGAGLYVLAWIGKRHCKRDRFDQR